MDRLNMTEKLFTGTLNHNQNKKSWSGDVEWRGFLESECMSLKVR